MTELNDATIDTDNITPRPAAIAAAAWWADRLFLPGVQDNGDEGQSLLATYVAATVLLRNGPMTPAERTLFAERLATRIEVHVFGRPWCGGIGVDYGPDLVLESALIAAVGRERANVLQVAWPIKTMMWVNPGEVKVRHGYRAEIQTIWNGEEGAAKCQDR